MVTWGKKAYRFDRNTDVMDRGNALRNFKDGTERRRRVSVTLIQMRIEKGPNNMKMGLENLLRRAEPGLRKLWGKKVKR